MAYPIRHLDFDEWRTLASSDPEAFEAMRRKVLQAVIDRAPEKRRQRLQGLQWRVDQVRRRSSSPMAACISLSDMMWESFAGDKGLVEALRGTRQNTPHQADNELQGARAEVVSMEKTRKGPS
jgi:hypothetical protein